MEEEMIRTKTFLSAIISAGVVIYVGIIPVFSISTFGDIAKLSTLGKTIPYAVRYKISEKALFHEQTQDAYEQGKITIQSKHDSMTATIANEWVFVQDTNGNERFDYIIQELPIDRKDMLLEPTYRSLFKSSTEVTDRVRCANGTYTNSASIYDSNYLTQEPFAHLYRYPAFGLGIISRGDNNGFISLDEAVNKEKGGTPAPESQIATTRISVDSEGFNVEIRWAQKGLPESIIYTGKTEDHGIFEITISEAGEKDGFIYPKKVKFSQKMNSTKYVRIVEIEVIEFIVGPAALEKYSVQPPPLGENPIIYDFRTAKK